jgi:hypothetical protein
LFGCRRNGRLPHCIIYGADGKLLAEGDTAEKWLWEWTE